MAYLQCVLGALVVPKRHLRIVRTAGTAQDAEEALRQLEPPVLSWVQGKNQPMVVNKTTTWNRGAASRGAPLAVRLLAVPVNGHGRVPAGVLMLLRSEDAPEFTPTHLSLIKLLGRHVASLLESDFDALTGLHTRSSAQAQVHSWDEARPPGPHSVIFFGIDRLGIVNDTKGFDAGDALMVRVAQLLAEPYLPPDAVAARLSSDKFAVALPHVNAEAASETARTLQQAAAQLPTAPAAGDEPVSLSCGIACFTEPHKFPSALALAYLAYRTARDHGRGRVEIYQDDDDSMIRRQSDSIAVIRLREALHNDHFTLFAQRLMSLQGRGDPEGYELLLRSLQSPHKNHAPADLLSAAHRSQLAPALDLWVVEHALAEAAPHRSALLATDTSLSINITGPSLTDATFLQRVERLIRGSRIAPSLITFEITETIAVLSLSKALKFVRELRAMGCRFALDDFGTGTNSLKNLTSLPVDHVKIDGSFVTDILRNPQSVAMVRAIVSLTRDLGIGTVAEYAENARIIQRLRELGVQYAQGYGVEKPRAFKEVLNELSTRESQENRALGREI
jgi:diguanylate cyclase (GGDEF)-like protein